jgi:adenosylhomocysteine nucleosidase
VKVLVVAALDEEVAHLPAGVDVAVTGVGKALAAAGLARRLAAAPLPDLVVNVGTAGAVRPGVHGVMEVGFVTQHDFAYAALERLLGGPTQRGFRLSVGAAPAAVPEAPSDGVALTTGDTFVADAAAAALIAAAGIHLVDMEGYGYAAACAEFGVPFRCVKAVSDTADEDAGASWLDMIDSCARELGRWVEGNVLAAT